MSACFRRLINRFCKKQKADSSDNGSNSAAPISISTSSASSHVNTKTPVARTHTPVMSRSAAAVPEPEESWEDDSWDDNQQHDVHLSVDAISKSSSAAVPPPVSLSQVRSAPPTTHTPPVSSPPAPNVAPASLPPPVAFGGMSLGSHVPRRTSVPAPVAAPAAEEPAVDYFEQIGLQVDKVKSNKVLVRPAPAFSASTIATSSKLSMAIDDDVGSSSSWGDVDIGVEAAGRKGIGANRVKSDAPKAKKPTLSAVDAGADVEVSLDF